ncbi:MAG: hypothetical protein K6A63_07865 [Acholeplasmatales bacterium]|nr:hypothetical protein [Acholeplasmatales bacterium]
MDNKWGAGIPKYRSQDVLSLPELQEYAVNVMVETESRNQKFVCFSKDYDIRTGVSVTGKVDNSLFYVMVRSAVQPETVEMTDFERNVLIAKSFAYGQACYFASVTVGSKDPERFAKGLLLWNDEYNINYSGMKYVPRDNYDKNLVYILTALEHIGQGYYIKDYSNFADYIAEDCVWHSNKSTITCKGPEEIKNYYASKLTILKKPGAYIDYYLCLADGKPALYIDQKLDYKEKKRLVFVELNDEGMISKMTLDSPDKYNIEYR